MEKFFKGLNESQRLAVETIDGALLILAGAGTGKTKTIVSRLSYFLANGISPSSILTLTFTNKAALEMRERALRLLENNFYYPPLLCTFHKFGLIFLKQHINRIDRSNSFVIIDTNDKKNILKNIIKSNAFDLHASEVAFEISRYKNSLLEPNEVLLQKSIQEFYKKIAKIYQEYQDYLENKNLVDFDDLLFITYKLLDKFEDLANLTSNRYQYLMVDEYQDTNKLQAKILKKICKNHNNICVVGDDDQSIYGWRGANISNILNFQKEFINTKIIKLEYNYRSTKKILQAANSLIEHNRHRLGKKLKATLSDGKDVEVIEFLDEKRESATIANKIKNLIRQGVNPKSIAILYRINALSRALEEGLNKEGIRYKIVGGFKFYERSEIKDLISYFRFISNPHDDFSLARIINRPTRGIAKSSFEKILREANSNKESVYSFCKNNKNELEKMLSKKAYDSINNFFEIIAELKFTEKNNIYNLIDELDSKLKIKSYFSSLTESIEKIANIDEFYAIFRDKIIQNSYINLDEFLNELALVQSEEDLVDDKLITIMSVHASKGLEFDYLFIIGMEEGFFPLIGDGCNLEEERRLCYVAITRAKQELVLSHTQSRFYKGRRTILTKSPFLKECGVIKGGFELSTKQSFKIGDLVQHKLFGMGRVLGVKKSGKNFNLTINFGGIKRDIISSFVEKI